MSANIYEKVNQFKQNGIIRAIKYQSNCLTWWSVNNLLPNFTILWKEIMAGILKIKPFKADFFNTEINCLMLSYLQYSR